MPIHRENPTAAAPLVALPTRQFTDAVHTFTAPNPVWIDGSCRWVESIYTRLRDSLTATTPKGAAAQQNSRLPCRIDVLSLLTDVDSIVAAWWPDAATTPDRLTKMCEHPWAPQHVTTLTEHITQLEQWTATGRELLGDTTIAVALRKPCPRCNQLWAYRAKNGETIRTYALTASDTGASCHNCNTTWTTDEYPFLARLLNG